MKNQSTILVHDPDDPTVITTMVNEDETNNLVVMNAQIDIFFDRNNNIIVFLRNTGDVFLSPLEEDDENDTKEKIYNILGKIETYLIERNSRMN